jgi:nucleoside-diphosphate-sugar epimerase
LIEAARTAGVRRFVFISTCAVHERILDDRPLDETHPTWATSHYGAHKAAIEQFVYSFGLGMGYPICALRPCGVYGVDWPVENSKWYSLVQDVVEGRPVHCKGGGKEVHASDVAKAAGILLDAAEAKITGQVFNCCDRYVSQLEVANLARESSGSTSVIEGQVPTPKHTISTDKLRSLGMQFGGKALLQQTIRELAAWRAR